MNRARPMPTGAMKVALCFSFASMNMVKTSSPVKNASIKRPRAVEVPSESVVRTWKCQQTLGPFDNLASTTNH